MVFASYAARSSDGEGGSMPDAAAIASCLAAETAEDRDRRSPPKDIHVHFRRNNNIRIDKGK